MIRRPPRSTPLSLHDALPISSRASTQVSRRPDKSHGTRGGTLRLAGSHSRNSAPSQSPSAPPDRKSTRLNFSHGYIPYAGFFLKKKYRHDLEASTLPAYPTHN